MDIAVRENPPVKGFFNPRLIKNDHHRDILRRQGFIPRAVGGSPMAAAVEAPSGHADAAPRVIIPFSSAAHEHTEQAFQLNNQALTAASQQLNVPDIPAYGYLRHLFLEVTCTGGTLGAGVLSPDWPWNLFQNIALVDTNSAPIFGPLDGYATLWSNIIGGYAYLQDPRKCPWLDTTINAKFYLRIPIEISHFDALGCLSNQNAAGPYRLQLQLNPTTTLFSTAPTTAPAVTIKAWLEAWSQPAREDISGHPQALTPPAHGTAQFWSSSVAQIAAGNNTTALKRVGSLIRNVAFIARTAAGVRSDTVFPDPLTLQWDARAQWFESQNYRVQKQFEAIENAGTRDAGVFWWNFNNSLQARAGDGPPTMWLPTVQATRLELDGVSAAAGSLQIVTNDISIAEIDPRERYVELSATGFHPEVGASNSYAQ